MKRLDFIVLTIISTMIFNSCKSDDQEVTSIDLGLIVNDQKTWYLDKILNNNNLIESFPDCIWDDEYEFKSNGDFITKNMGTVYVMPADTTYFDPVAQHCFDTTFIDNIEKWELLDSGDLRIYNGEFEHVFKIIELTENQFVFDRQTDGIIIQREYYKTK
jgi:hypothetical protein